MGILKGFGLIDIIFLILWLRITYEAVSKGIFIEILKLLALFINSVFTFQFYPFLAERISNKISFLDKDFVKAVTAIALFFIIGIIFGLLIKIIDAFFKRKEITSSEKLAAVIFGFLRLALLASIIVFLLYLFPAKPQFINGYTSRIFKNVAPKVYLMTAGVYNRFIPGLAVNTEVEKIYEAKDDLSGNNKNGN